LILVQAAVNLFAVMGLAPLTGVPLPFVSYGNSSLMATLFAVGLILNVARGGKASVARDSGTAGGAGKLRVVDGGRKSAPERSRASSARKAKGRGGGGGNRGARGARNGGRRRASG
jgi:cell division protein FtsW